MLEKRSLKLDLFALILFALTVFLSLAILTYNPADPVGDLLFPLDRLHLDDVLVYPLGSEITNVCGRLGAVTSALLFGMLGVGTYYLLTSLTVLDYLLLTRREIKMPAVRLGGWILSLLGLTGLAAMVLPGIISFSALTSRAAMLLPGLSPGPVIGPGGYLGALGRAALESHFATVGGIILAVAFVVGGLLLCTDYVLIRISIVVLAVAFDSIMGGKKLLAGRIAARAKGADDETAAEDEALSVRIRGRRVVETEEQDEGEYDDQDEEDQWDEEYEQEEGLKDEHTEPSNAEGRSLLGKVRRHLRPPLRIRHPSERKKAKRKESERDEVIHQLEAASQSDEPADYELPSPDLLLAADQVPYDEQESEVRRKAKILEKTFANFGFNVKVVEIETGPVIAQYEVQLEAGLRLSRITGLADDLAIALRVPSVRIVAPIPGKNTVGIEVPNRERQIVRLREIIDEMNGRGRKMRIPLFLGKDVSGSPLTVDLSTLPHLLIAGRTGTGKSVCLNAIISSILMTRRPDEVRMLLIDPKMVELSCYKTLPHLMHPVVTDMRKAEAILGWAVEKMEERYELLARAGVRHLSVYNQLGEEELMERFQPECEEDRKAIPLHLPYILIVADELADLMMTSGKEVEQHIIRLAQKSRAVGIHLIMATQKPTVDVITGLIKSNLPARIAFQVASRTDSRVVLDEMGADKLLGNGDMLFLWPGTSTLLRGQGTYLSDDEINRLVEAVSTGEQHFVKELVHLKVEDPESEQPGKLKNRDELYENAVDVVVREGRGSVSLLQRSLGIGYGRAARLIDFMAEDGIVGPYAGSQAREVMLSLADWERMQQDDSQPEPAAPAPTKKRRRSNKIVPRHDDETATFAPAVQHKDDTEEVAPFDGLSYEENEYEDGEWDENDAYEENEYEEEEYEEDEYEKEEYEDEAYQDRYEAESA